MLGFLCHFKYREDTMQHDAELWGVPTMAVSGGYLRRTVCSEGGCLAADAGARLHEIQCLYGCWAQPSTCSLLAACSAAAAVSVVLARAIYICALHRCLVWVYSTFPGNLMQPKLLCAPVEVQTKVKLFFLPNWFGEYKISSERLNIGMGQSIS